MNFKSVVFDGFHAAGDIAGMTLAAVLIVGALFSPAGRQRAFMF
jgi:hypothetical protein